MIQATHAEPSFPGALAQPPWSAVLDLLLRRLEVERIVALDLSDEGFAGALGDRPFVHATTFQPTPLEPKKAFRFGTEVLEGLEAFDGVVLDGEVHFRMLDVWLEEIARHSKRLGQPLPTVVWRTSSDLERRNRSATDRGAAHREGVFSRYDHERHRGIAHAIERFRSNHRGVKVVDHAGPLGLGFAVPEPLSIKLDSALDVFYLLSALPGAPERSFSTDGFLHELQRFVATAKSATSDRLWKGTDFLTRLFRSKSPRRTLRREARVIHKHLDDVRASTDHTSMPPSLVPVAAPSDLSVTYLLPQLAVNGGVLGVTQLVNELAKIGVDTRLATTRVRPQALDWPLAISPMVFESEDELVANTPATDIVVATHWTTAQWAHRIVARGGAKTHAYFVQDYEAWFFPDDPIMQDKVRATYDLIPNKIVKSDWLADLLTGDGHSTKKIHLGMNLGMFYPRDLPRLHPSVFSMLRFATPRRGSENTVKALTRVLSKIQDTRVSFFGEDLTNQDIPFAYEDLKAVSNQGRLAEVYSRSSVFIDGSKFQAFGRPALEAMACGAACVLTDVGGVGEYARHEDNCLLVQPDDSDALADSVIRLLEDDELRMSMQSRGFETVSCFAIRREAIETREYFRQVL